MSDTGCRRVLGRVRGDAEFRGDLWREVGTGEVAAKRDAPDVLARELRRKVGEGDRIRLGVLADPWPRAEARDRVTRRALEVLVRGTRAPVHLETKSDLALRDLDLLLCLRDRGGVSVGVSVPTLDPGLARRLEPRFPSPSRRLAVVRRLAGAGIAAGVEIAPVLPGLTDSLGALSELAGAAAGAGAAWVRARALVLPPAARSAFFRFLRQERPALLPRYFSRYRHRAEAPPAYVARLSDMMASIRIGLGLAAAPPGEREPVGQRLLPFDPMAEAGGIR